MAKIGNETNLILKLARERMKHAPRLKEEVDFRMQPGNYPERYGLPESMRAGYTLAVREYEKVFAEIISSLESR